MHDILIRVWTWFQFFVISDLSGQMFTFEDVLLTDESWFSLLMRADGTVDSVCVVAYGLEVCWRKKKAASLIKSVCSVLHFHTDPFIQWWKAPNSSINQPVSQEIGSLKHRIRSTLCLRSPRPTPSKTSLLINAVQIDLLMQIISYVIQPFR